MKRAFVCVMALIATGVLMTLYPLLEEHLPEDRLKELIVIWLPKGESDTAAFMKKAAAVYEKQTGCRVYLRTCSEQELQGASSDSEDVIRPDGAIGAGNVPLFYRGYALVVPDEGKQVQTPAPTPALFYRPTATPQLTTPEPRRFPEHLASVSVPQGMENVLENSKVSENPLSDYASGRVQAALLTPRQIDQLKFGYQAHVRADFFCPVMGAAFTEDGERFFSFLRSDEVQRLLAGQKLFSWNREMQLYGPEQELMYSMENVRKISE